MRVLLDIADETTKLTIQAMLQRDGHELVSASPDVVVAGDARGAVIHARSNPTVVLASMGEISQAVWAMRRGVYGYIFLPLQPGEAGLMVERAASLAAGAPVAAEPQSHGTIDDAESRLILATLRQCKYNRTKAARALGIGRNTLWRKLRKMGWGEMKDARSGTPPTTGS
jgi:DNA-binding NtrC family response regulator